MEERRLDDDLHRRCGHGEHQDDEERAWHEHA
jgi:hypothetical protein